MNWRFTLFLLLHLIPALVAEPTSPEFTDVYQSSTDGYHTYRIPALLLSKEKTLLAFCEGRRSTSADNGQVDLLLKRSTDLGKTWSEQQIIWSDGQNTCGNPTPILDHETGIIWLLMTWNLGADHENQINHKTSRDTRRVFVTHSADDGVTWSKPEEITESVKLPDWQWYATGPVNGIQLTRGPHKGRLLAPANHSELVPTKGKGSVVLRSHVIYSDDHGKTWKLGGIGQEKTNESTIAELSDGSVMQNMRSYAGKNQRAVAVSKDGGLTWTDFHLDPALVEPVCQGSLLRATWAAAGRKSRLLFCNPASKKRENLTLRISYNEGSSWAISKTLFQGPSAYSCLTMLGSEQIGCLFENGVKGPYEKITLARVPLAWLETK